jgi:Ser/Thr protein kinase RdoA (MazF antagonist)
LHTHTHTHTRAGLAKQVIHGDLHFLNVMVEGDKVSGLLDFEFCVYDWRVMELAVALVRDAGRGGDVV